MGLIPSKACASAWGVYSSAEEALQHAAAMTAKQIVVLFLEKPTARLMLI
jgi:hypothetical protein